MEDIPRIGFGSRSQLTKAVTVFVVILIICAIIIPLTMFRTAGVGYGVVLVNPMDGTISEPLIGPTWFLKAPWVSDVHLYYAIDSVGMWTEGQVQGDYPAVTPMSKDGLRIEVDLQVRWSLDPTKLKTLYQTFPALDWKTRAISSVIRETTRDVVGHYTAIEIIENRTDITQALSAGIVTSLFAEKSLGDALVSVEVDLRDIDPPIEFLQAIEGKLAAEQSKLAAEFERERILILANASAAERIIAADGEATSRLIIANGTAESIRIIAENTELNTTELTNLYLTLEALKEIAETSENFVVILGQDGLTYLLPVAPEEP
ncbi:MAG: prohibitin family protein [Candidatus Bathyarchaeota archaeon]|nr:MAG: prohibitin family protein [Candidatus Bathyarchaeota archaeon]